MIKTKISLLISTFLVLIFCQTNAQTNDENIQNLLNKTKVKGGLCLVIGAKDLIFVDSLVKLSSLYVQVLQPDEKLYLEWSKNLADAFSREKMGVRNSKFDPKHYDSDLFNLIIVDDLLSIDKFKLADFFRILVPDGKIVFKKEPTNFNVEAKELKMSLISDLNFQAIYHKAVKPEEWKLPLTKKWEAGPQSQIASGYDGIFVESGKLFYLERMEVDQGDLAISGVCLFARDAYNGKTIWSLDLPGIWNRNIDLAVTKKGLLFALTSEGKILKINAENGVIISEFKTGIGRETKLKCLNDDLLCVGSSVYSSDTGNLVWKFPIKAYQPMKETIINENVYFSDGVTLDIRNLADGKEISKIVLEGVDSKLFGGLLAIDKKLFVRIGSGVSLLDSVTGKIIWTYNGIPGSNKKAGLFSSIDNDLFAYIRQNQEGKYADEFVVEKIDFKSGKIVLENKVLQNVGDYHGCFPGLPLGDFVVYHDLTVNKKTLETILQKFPHPACFFGMKTGYGMIYNFPSRKSRTVIAYGHSEYKINQDIGGKTLHKYGNLDAAEPAKEGDWPLFRGIPSGGNSTKNEIGEKLVKKWSSQIGLGKNHFGLMSSQHTGLTQSISANGLAIVSDIDGQCIVALEAIDGKKKWAFHVGSRVDFSPSLYNGLCLFTSRDGWVYCLNVKSGALIYKLLVPAEERYIGGYDKIESIQPITSDVIIDKGIAYVENLAFKPETGEVVNSDPKLIKTVGREFNLRNEYLLKGNTIPRTNEDNKGGFIRGKIEGRVLAFDDSLTVAYDFTPKGEGWANQGTLHIMGFGSDQKKALWKTDPIELVVDDIVLTPQYIYCVGHYQRIKKDPEIWVMSRENGKVLSVIPVEGYPSFLGMSVVGKNLMVSTRDGKLICFEKSELK